MEVADSTDSPSDGYWPLHDQLELQHPSPLLMNYNPPQLPPMQASSSRYYPSLQQQHHLPPLGVSTMPPMPPLFPHHHLHYTYDPPAPPSTLPQRNRLPSAMLEPSEPPSSPLSSKYAAPPPQLPSASNTFATLNSFVNASRDVNNNGGGGGGGSPGGSGTGPGMATGSPPSSSGSTPSPTPRLPPILQVEKQVVTTSATQAASASRRTNAASFQCPVPSCTSTFTRRFNLRGHLRSHTEEKPYVCEYPECGKGFARQHDCKRHQALHNKPQGAHPCATCGRSFSRIDALSRHMRSEGGSGCKKNRARNAASSVTVENGTGSSESPPPDDSSPPPYENRDVLMEGDDISDALPQL